MKETVPPNRTINTQHLASGFY
jgi:hypothetical protein